MRATNWEFKNRATIFGLIFGLAFSAYVLDPQNSVAALANWLGATRGIDANLIARSLFLLASCLLVIAALVRTWASSYLNAQVVYASEVKTESLVADGPYRRVRNPLYFANILLAIGMGAHDEPDRVFRGHPCDAGVLLPADFSRRVRLASPARASSTGATTRPYRVCGPPGGRALLPPEAKPGGWTGSRRNSGVGDSPFQWLRFAITLNLPAFFVILGASVVVLWLSTWVIDKRTRGARPADP